VTYQANLELVITQLEKTNAKLIWVTSCPAINGYDPAGSLDANGTAPGRATRSSFSIQIMEAIHIVTCRGPEEWT
tara:strand:- start:27 stop:251 length:225 start_codon:yes stop_codon:yes gene_type:complete